MSQSMLGFSVIDCSSISILIWPSRVYLGNSNVVRARGDLEAIETKNNLDLVFAVVESDTVTILLAVHHRFAFHI